MIFRDYFLRILICMGLFVLAMAAPSASAQTESGTVPAGWEADSFGTGIKASAYEACEDQWKNVGMNNGYSRLIGARPRPDNPRNADCEWTRRQYLCPEETGGGMACGTVIPGTVSLVCPRDYFYTQDGYCRLNAAAERPCPKCPGDDESDGRVNPQRGNPVVLSTGAKILSVVDYVSPDGLFRIGRSYRSFQGGRMIQDRLPRSLPVGLDGFWNFDFTRELQLGRFNGTPQDPDAHVAILMPDGSHYGFVLQSDGTWIEKANAGTAAHSKNLKLEFVGQLPANLLDIRYSTSTWRLTDKSDRVWTIQTRVGPNDTLYDYGWPTSMVARDGYSQTFAYNADGSLASLTDSFGRTATFSWDLYQLTTLQVPPSGLAPTPWAIRSIGLPDGTSLEYDFELAVSGLPSWAIYGTSTWSRTWSGGSGTGNSVWAYRAPAPRVRRLTGVTRLDSTGSAVDSVGYKHENDKWLRSITGIVDHTGTQVATYEYDDQGRVTSSALTDGYNLTEVDYGRTGSARTRVVKNAFGQEDAYTFTLFNSTYQDYRLTGIDAASTSDTNGGTTTVAYGSDTFVSSVNDAEGRLVTTQRDARGRPTTIVEASGTPDARTTTIAYHATFNVPVSIVQPNLTETRTYTATGQLETLTLTDTTGHTAPYSTAGQARTWTYGWDANGRLLSLDGPLPTGPSGENDLESYTYYADGNLHTATNALGHATTYGDYDAGGRAKLITDPNGVDTRMTYDALGRVLTLTVEHPTDPAQNATTTLTYDPRGHVASMALPATDTLFFSHNSLGQMTSMYAASGERWDFTYDAMGNVLEEKVSASNGSLVRLVRRAFDDLGRLSSVVAGNKRTPAAFDYDRVGNLTGVTSANGHKTTYSFDALDRVTSTLAPDGGSSGTTYDAQDNALDFTDPVSVTTQFTYNGFGEVIQEISPDRGTTIYWYDEAGRLSQTQDARGHTVTYTRDMLGRITRKAADKNPATEVIDYEWDTAGLTGSYGIGRLAKMTDESWITRFAYDHRGNLTTKRQLIGSGGMADLAYEYDLADRITQITYPSGREVAYDYDSKGRVSQVRTRISASTPAWTTVASNYTYQPYGPVAAYALGNGLAVTNTWATDGMLAERRLYDATHAADLSHLAYRRDANGNISAITDHVTPSKSVLYGYDEMDRLTLTVAEGAASGGESYSYTAGTNQLASFTDDSGTRSYSYNALGNTSSESRPGSVSVAATYNGFGQLLSYDRSNTGLQTYTYNGLGDRVKVVKPTATRYFVYDSDGRVMAEYGTDASDVKAEFIWANPALAVLSPFGGGDHIGGYAPLAVATPDSFGAPELRWVHGNHLGVPVVTTDASGAPIAPQNDYMLPGFPGQSMALTDLYYNRHRDYDPVTGRYIQADPLGLGGGSNLYLYAGANPVNAIDPNGRNPILLGILIGAGFELFLQALDNYRRGRSLLDPNCYEWGEVAFAGAMGAFGGNWVKGMVRMTPGKMHFSAVSQRIRRNNNLVGEPVDLHHWLVPQRFYKNRPHLNKFFNRPWNLNVVSRNFHQQTLNNLNYPSMVAFGAPKAVQAAVAASLVAGAVEISDGELDD